MKLNMEDQDFVVYYFLGFIILGFLVMGLV